MIGIVKAIIKHGIMWLSTKKHGGRGSKILYYHDVFSTINHKALDADIQMGTPLSVFKEHIRIIRENEYEIVPKITKPEGQVAIMFDDGFNGIWECREFFYTNNITPTIFLPVEFIGNSSKGILSKEQIIELQSHGFIFESHGWSHRPLTDVPAEELEKELKESRNFLSDLLGKQISGICFPLGYFSENLIKKAKNAGYTELYSSIPGNIDDLPFGMLHRNLCQFASARELRLILRGGNELLKQRYEKQHNHTINKN